MANNMLRMKKGMDIVMRDAIYNTEEIVRRFNQGEQMEFIFFWGHTAKPGKITKACLSQWFPCDFQENGVAYHTTEQYMMSRKALLFEDQETYRRIMEADNPRDYKSLGREVKNFNKATWDAQKFEIVVRGNIAKFSRNAELMEYLLSTEDKILVEASPYDNIWGVNLASDNPDIQDPNNWRGENLLGFALTKVRDMEKTKRGLIS